MKGMTFKKAFLLGGIFLLSTFMLVQLSWGCDDDDKWDRDHHDKQWGCDDHDKGGCDHPHHQCYPPLVIQSVDVQNDQILIHGENFDNGPDLVVTLGGKEIVAERTNSNEIVATLPSPADFPHSDYRLVVSTGHGKNCRDKYCLTIGAAGPPLGTIESVIVSGDGALDPETSQVIGTANCNTANGYALTGGGFQALKGVTTIIISKPTDDGKGWYVVGTPDTKTEDPTLKVYAICAKVK